MEKIKAIAVPVEISTQTKLSQHTQTKPKIYINK